MDLLGLSKPFIGVIHLPPLPGAPGHCGERLQAIVERAASDATALAAGGADAAIVENFGDAPFARIVSAETTAAMAILVSEVHRRTSLRLGVNVLRNDGVAALGIAAAADAAFIRINVFCGSAVTDSGWVDGTPRRLIELRRRLGATVAILADVHVKHAAHFNSLEEAALDASRNGADALIVTGAATGHAPSPEDVSRVKASGRLPVVAGSGITEGTVSAFAHADGFIVGSTLHCGGDIMQPVDATRVRRVAEAIAALRTT